jgi:hypothetical protein
MPALTLSTLLVTWAAHELEWVYVAGTLLWAFGCFGAFLFAGEPLGPSQRVLAHWQQRGTSALRKSLGPGILSASTLLLVLTLLGLSCSAALGAAEAKSAADRDALLAFHGYGLSFFGFVVGFSAWARARADNAGTPRLLLAAALFVAFVGPWIAMAVAGLLTNQHDEAVLMASPSPTFVVTMAQAISTSAPDAGLVATAGCACAAAWALIGVGLFTAAGLRVRARQKAEAAARAKLQRAFDEEEAALQAAAQAAPSEA